MTVTLFADPLKMQLLTHDLERIARRNGPRSGDLAHAPVLVGCRIHWQRVPVLVGWVAGHPELPDGAVETSQLFALDTEDWRWARTMSRWYSMSMEANRHG